MLVILTRSKEDNQTLSEWLSSKHIAFLDCPLQQTILHEDALTNIDWRRYGGIIATSRHGLILAAKYKAALDLPLWLVGQRTAADAKTFGWANTLWYQNASELSEALAGKAFQRPLLYLRGEVISHDLAARFTFIEQCITYHIHRVDTLSDEFQRQFQQKQPMLFPLYSVTAAEHLQSLISQLNPPHKPHALCLSASIAAALQRRDWAEISIADATNDAAMRAALLRLACVSPR